MKKFALVLIVAILAAVSSPAFAAEASIAVLDVQKLLSDSKAAASLQQQIVKERQSFQDKFSKIEKDLREEDQKLSGAKSSMSSEDFDSQRQKLEEKVLDTNRLAKKSKRDMDEAFTAAVNQLREEIVKIATSVAQKEGYAMVISRQNAIVLQKDMDITDKVLAELDKSLPTIALKIPAQ